MELCIHGKFASVSAMWTNPGSGDRSLHDLQNFETLISDHLNALVNAEQSTNSSLDYFEYEDDEGDHLAVKTEEEFQDMLTFVCNSNLGVSGSPLHIYPVGLQSPVSKCSKVVGLRVDTMSLSSQQTKRESLHSDTGFHNILNRSQLKAESLKLMNILGSGHCGTVYKALNVEKDKLMAVKCVSLDISTDAQNQILTEMEVLYKCFCPYIMELEGALFVDNQFWLCMEYMNIGALDRFGRIPEDVLIPISVAVFLGLSYLWTIKIMHRDVKPSNILLNDQGAVKICDFGVSVELQRSIAKSYVGTNAYMAPERILGGDYRICSDIWSLGLTILEMISGEFPFSSDKQKTDKPVNIMERILTEDPMQKSNAIFQDEVFYDFVSFCVRRDPDLRPNPEILEKHDFITANSPVDHIKISKWAKNNQTTLQNCAH